MKKISVASCLFATLFLFSLACFSPKAAPTASEGVGQVIAALNTEDTNMTTKIASETLCSDKDRALVTVWTRNAKCNTNIVKMPMVMNGVWKLDLVKAIRAGM